MHISVHFWKSTIRNWFIKKSSSWWQFPITCYETIAEEEGAILIIVRKKPNVLLLAHKAFFQNFPLTAQNFPCCSKSFLTFVSAALDDCTLLLFPFSPHRTYVFVSAVELKQELKSHDFYTLSFIHWISCHSTLMLILFNNALTFSPLMSKNFYAIFKIFKKNSEFLLCFLHVYLGKGNWWWIDTYCLRRDFS